MIIFLVIIKLLKEKKLGVLFYFQKHLLLSIYFTILILILLMLIRLFNFHLLLKQNFVLLNIIISNHQTLKLIIISDSQKI